jgi:hypothetical protein
VVVHDDKTDAKRRCLFPHLPCDGHFADARPAEQMNNHQNTSINAVEPSVLRWREETLAPSGSLK